ncbi:Uncharacterised protein (plasmid) [Tsukamurella tyrosinosolvens]|uniref:Uncharacterized protein n=1 Tax=Tsukamurella tyrosinosolvens TaxID=57704 RepID=A0A1H4VME2_TSUTY|nr:hypothetical protein [Tsukamurella tyrosinosolvens]SEC82030.1 hypothetical protein SAMN04489793_3271 [Tsukamurella tyrosinosolvens]VEH90432.1 Uncharacterised protein [Tsukamurella tyrosinosolvens]
MTVSIGSDDSFAKLAPCVDHAGHRFRIEPSSSNRSCCERCGLIRTTPPSAQRIRL